MIENIMMLVIGFAIGFISALAIRLSSIILTEKDVKIAKIGIKKPKRNKELEKRLSDIDKFEVL